MNQTKYLTMYNFACFQTVAQWQTYYKLNTEKHQCSRAAIVTHTSLATCTWYNLILATSYPLPLKYILPFRQIYHDLCSTYVIPPTFTEVWKLVFQTVLQKLKHYTDDHTHPPVSNHQCLYKGRKKIKSFKYPQALHNILKTITKMNTCTPDWVEPDTTYTNAF